MNHDFEYIFGSLVVWIFYFFIIFGIPRRILRAFQSYGQEMHETRADLLEEAPSNIQLVNEQHERLFSKDRIIGDFVLTRAVVLKLPIVIYPTEGFRLSKKRELGKGMYQIIAAVSAEKILGLLQDAVPLLGRSIDMEVFDTGAEAGKTVSYLTGGIEPSSLLPVLQQHGAFIINCGEIALNLRGDNRAQLFLEWNKHICIITKEREAAIDLLHDYGIHEIPGLRFFFEEEYYLNAGYQSNDYPGRLLEAMHVQETRYFS